MHRSPCRWHGLVTAVLLLAAGCGGTTYIDSTPDGRVAGTAVGWHRVEPKRVDLPRGSSLVPAPQPARAGAPVLVNVWASYCKPCQKELPILQGVSESGQMVVVGLSRDRRRDDAIRALELAGVTYENRMDSGATFTVELDGRIPLALVPSSALLVDGKVVAVHIGPFADRADLLGGLRFARPPV